MARFLQNLYKSLIDAELRAEGINLTLPERVQRCFVNWAGYEALYFIRRLVGEARRVLVIGDFFGRDYWSLRLVGKNVFALDIAPQRGIDRLVLGDVTQPLPFKDGSFDAVVMAEVIEHLVADHSALENIYRLLTNEGKLILTVPFLHDAPEVHIRVHTPASIRRLLEACGFTIETLVVRGLVSLDSRLLKRLIHLLNLISYTGTRKTFYQPLLRRLADISWQVGQKYPALLRRSKLWGAYMKCGKTSKTDFKSLNVQEFATIKWNK